ncbi:Protein of unknown function [Bacillus wiedmannii]|uniref:Uncharacterized protein n=2 Tax=Bacillus cereus group TaxID=86661 RepID=A0A1C4DPT9_BACTU|nr:Protein of unknown function [Bacillus wiedmannii]SCC33383.1 Protein of unknown function [Bacillus thuringiensis]SCL95369.1 Protein of unknown function [Bacillus wiedmannii]SCN44947.1 Protein of unknown function [Bacillus cereus]
MNYVAKRKGMNANKDLAKKSKRYL